MISIRVLGCASLFALAACNTSPASNDTSSRQGTASSQTALSPAERTLIDGGATEADVRAARAFIEPFTRTDPASCFGTPALNKAKFNEASDTPGAPPVTRVAIAIDGSGSMAGKIGSRTKLERAHEATRAFIDGLPKGVPASLTVFGQQGDNSESGKEKSCRAVDVLAPMSTDRNALKRAVDGVRAVGWTPLAEGLRSAQQQLGPSSVMGEQVIYIVSDGVETCGGDPVAVARTINQGGTKAIVNIIGFGLPTGEAATLQSVASAGGGRFVNVTDDNGFARAMAAYREQMRAANNRVASRMTQAGNSIATGATATDVTMCTGGIIQRERTGALADYDARSKRGEMLPPRYLVVALLQDRHSAMSAGRDAHIQRIRATEGTANAAIDAARKAAH